VGGMALALSENRTIEDSLTFAIAAGAASVLTAARGSAARAM